MKVTKSYDERHAEILEISLQLFIKNGMKETTVNDIVKAVNIAKGTFYHYFESKDDLILMLRANYMRGFLALTADYIAQCKSSDWHGKIHAWCMGSIQHYYDHKAEHDEQVIKLLRVLHSCNAISPKSERPNAGQVCHAE